MDTMEPTAQPRKMTLATFATIGVVMAALHFGKDVVLPLAIATLITFALSPAESYLHRRGLPKIVSVLGVVTLAFCAIAVFLLVVATQLSQLAEDLPKFQSNIVAKLESIETSSGQSRILSRLTGMFSAINDKFAQAIPATVDAAGAVAGGQVGAPVSVQVVEQRNPLVTLRDLAMPLVSPIATSGLVVVVVIFMLLEREELRDRFIRLVGAQDLSRSTAMMEDAGSRVANYLVTQLLVNTIYAVPIGIGLWFIGVPNAILWAILTLVLRFVPYIGSILAAMFPLFLAFAVSPGWSVVIWTAVLFAAVELITSNVIEPWLYGSRTGLTPLAIIIAAIVWTWMWGPLGLVLSTPLTVCLVVLGRYLPQFEIFDVLFGDEPVLSAHSRLYQRLLAGDVLGSTMRAEEELETAYIADYYRDVGIPALLLAQRDYGRGVLSGPQQQQFADAATVLLADLEPVVDAELAEVRAPQTTGADAAAGHVVLEGDGYTILSTGGRSTLDDVAAGMLAQSMKADGAEAYAMSYQDLTTARFDAVIGTAASCIILNFLDPNPTRASLLHIRRIKRAAPDRRVGVVIWQMSDAMRSEVEDPLQAKVTPEKRKEAEDLGADFVVTNGEEARAAAYSDAKPKRITQSERRTPRAPLKSRVAAPA